jgi:8-oxo-dGTP diphosphatase
MKKEALGAFVIVLDSQKRVLLGLRKNSYKTGVFGCPGGRLELTETLKTCAIRELHEETGLKPKKLNYLGVIRELQDGYNFIHFVFLCDEFEGQVALKEPNKCVGWNFYSMDNLPDEILPAHLAGIDMITSLNNGYVDMVK